MRALDAVFRPVDRNEYFHRSALESDSKNLIDEDVIISENGRPIILYRKIEVDSNNLRWACINTKYDTSKRTSGLASVSRTFGFMPRRTLYADYCHDSDANKIGVKQNAIFKTFSESIIHYYEDFFPEELARHKQTVENAILPEWRIKNSPFTSGIVNKDNPLKYHYDSGNFEDCLSNMVAFKKGVKGGRLVCPEYDLKFEIADNTILIFDGQKILHGVTPIQKIRSDAYRYTVVYYSLKQMWKCEPLSEEVARIRKVKTEREQKRTQKHNPK